MPEYVKIKIAAVINAEGEWGAAGWNTSPDKHSHEYEGDVMDIALEGFDIDSTLQKYWIIAELEVPEKVKIEEIKGEVKGYA